MDGVELRTSGLGLFLLTSRGGRTGACSREPVHGEAGPSAWSPLKNALVRG